jgi:hypothetical protein
MLPSCCCRCDGGEHSPFAGPIVEINQNNLLPCSQRQLPAEDGDAKVRLQECGAEMGISVAITPSGVVGVIRVHRRDLIQRPSQVGERTRLIFYSRQCGGGAFNKQVQYTFVNTAALQRFLRLGSDVEDLVESSGGEMEFHVEIISSAFTRRQRLQRV